LPLKIPLIEKPTGMTEELPIMLNPEGTPLAGPEGPAGPVAPMAPGAPLHENVVPFAATNFVPPYVQFAPGGSGEPTTD